MLSRAVPCKLERWYSRYGFRARYNLSNSAAPALRTGDLLALGGANAAAEYMALDLNYGSPEGGPRLRAAIAAQYAALTPADIQVTTGAAEAIFLVLNALLSAGDAVVVQFPIYPAVYGVARMLDAEVRCWPLGPEHAIDLDQLEALLAVGRVRAVVLNHPHSPTGALLSAAELHAISGLTARYGTTLIVDEVYRGIQFAGPVLPAAADLGPHIISIGDLAKPYGLGGLRVGWIATADADVRQRCAELRDYTSLSSSVPGEFLAALALEHRDALLQRHLATARRNRALFAAAMADTAWMVWRLADGGFTIFPRLTLGRPTVEVCEELRERFDVLLLPGEVYERPGYLRLGFGVEPADFAAGLERLLAFGTAKTGSTRLGEV